MDEITTPMRKIHLMKASGLATKVLLCPGEELQESWLPAIFDRFIACVHMDHDLDSRASLQVLKHLMSLAVLNEEIPIGEAGGFGEKHPNQFFMNHGLRIGHEVVYQVERMEIPIYPDRPFRCRTRIHGKVVSTGYGTTENRSYADSVEFMLRSCALRTYCIELEGFFSEAFSTLHACERASSVVTDPEGYIAGYYGCSRRSVISGLHQMVLPPIEKVSPHGIRMIVPRVLTYFERHAIVLSIGVHKSITASSELTYRRLCSVLLTGETMLDVVSEDKVLFSPSVLSVMGYYYPHVPYYPEVVRSYQRPRVVNGVRVHPPPQVATYDPPIHVDLDMTLSYVPEDHQVGKRPIADLSDCN